MGLKIEQPDRVVAVGLSGGADSLALTHVLAQVALHPVHALIVDHGLREESSVEAEQVYKTVCSWPNVRAQILCWDAPKPKTRLMEAARAARYALMAAYCRAHDIRFLYLAHHGDDQAETVLARLAKGSGVDGLAGMQREQAYDKHLTIVRPLLSYRHEDCIAYCRAQGLIWVEDPSNINAQYLRPRLRAAQSVLAQEGLTVPHLMHTATRARAARDALMWMTDRLWAEALVDAASDSCTLRLSILQTLPSELVIRLIKKAMVQVGPARAYDPRLLRLEAVVDELTQNGSLSGRTLAGCKIATDRKASVLRVSRQIGA